MKIVCCIIARTNSTRLEKKALREINGKKMIEYIIDKMKRVNNLDCIYLCTSIDENDEILLQIAKKNGINGYAGSRDSVVDRMLEVAKIEKADYLVRVTGDNIFTDEIFLEKMIEEQQKNPSVDYTRCEYLPLGITAEIINVSALEICRQNMDPDMSQYLLLYIFDPDKFNCQVLIPEDSLRGEYCSLTVDTPEDLERTQFIIDRLVDNYNVYYDDIMKLSKNTEIPNFKVNKYSQIKLPYNKTITYEDFRRNVMAPKIEKSKKIYLEEGFYETYKNKQE